MKCPDCPARSKVVDSRYLPSTHATRRRRVCPRCGTRDTTYEVTEDAYRELLGTRHLLSVLRKSVV